jgi:hypothetical protein
MRDARETTAVLDDARAAISRSREYGPIGRRINLRRCMAPTDELPRDFGFARVV